MLMTTWNCFLFLLFLVLFATSGSLDDNNDNDGGDLFYPMTIKNFAQQTLKIWITEDNRQSLRGPQLLIDGFSPGKEAIIEVQEGWRLVFTFEVVVDDGDGDGEPTVQAQQRRRQQKRNRARQQVIYQLSTSRFEDFLMIMPLHVSSALRTANPTHFEERLQFLEDYFVRNGGKRTWKNYYPRASPFVKHFMYDVSFIGQQCQAAVSEQENDEIINTIYNLSVLCTQPKLLFVANLLSPAECQHLITLFRQREQEGKKSTIMQSTVTQPIGSASYPLPQQHVSTHSNNNNNCQLMNSENEQRTECESTGGDGDGDTGVISAVNDQIRVSSQTWIERNTDAVTDRIFRRIGRILKVNDNEMHENRSVEALQIVRYSSKVNGKYGRHFDFVPRLQPENRFITVLMYLNDFDNDRFNGRTAFYFEGGKHCITKADHNHNHFNNINIGNNDNAFEIHGGSGNAVVFYNLLADGNIDDTAEHAGLPVINRESESEIEKWIANLWIWDPVRARTQAGD